MPPSPSRPPPQPPLRRCSPSGVWLVSRRALHHEMRAAVILTRSAEFLGFQDFADGAPRGRAVEVKPNPPRRLVVALEEPTRAGERVVDSEIRRRLVRRPDRSSRGPWLGTNSRRPGPQGRSTVRAPLGHRDGRRSRVGISVVMAVALRVERDRRAQPIAEEFHVPNHRATSDLQPLPNRPRVGYSPALTERSRRRTRPRGNHVAFRMTLHRV